MRLLPAALLVACGSSAPSAPWAALPPLPAARQETGVAALGGKIYVVGGFDSAGRVVATVEAYDVEARTWAAKAPLPRALHHANVAAAGGKVYVAGALAGASFAAAGDVFEYDPAADRWTQKASMPAGTERGASGVAVLGGLIYAAGGFRGGSVADFSAYDPARDAWETLPALPAARDHLIAAAAGGVFLAIGGRKGGALDGRVDAWDPAARSWSPRAAMRTARAGIAGAAAGTRVAVFGGEGNAGAANGIFPHTEIYDAAADRWSAAADMPTPRHGTGAAAIDRTFFVPGGATVQGFGASAAFEAFTLP